MTADLAVILPPAPYRRLIGARAYRVLFAGISLPLATLAVVYFINHRYCSALSRQAWSYWGLWLWPSYIMHTSV